MVVRPSRMERATFSCYDNFVTSNSVGSPEHCDNAGAVPHLRHLLRGLEVVNVLLDQAVITCAVGAGLQACHPDWLQ